MNPLIIIIVLVVVFFSWILVVSLRRGEFHYKNRSSTGIGTGYAHVKRSERPAVFWFFAALHLGIILYIASLAFELE